MEPNEMLERMAEACVDPDYETWSNLAPKTQDQIRHLIHAALRELAVLVDNESGYLVEDHYWAAVGDAVKEILEVEL